MTEQFLHLYIKPKEGITTEQIKEKLNKALDWYRYGSGLYIIYTNSDHEKWYRILEDFAKPEGSIFICKLDINISQGWMTKGFWEWIKTKNKTE
jgi:hypothetical protein